MSQNSDNIEENITIKSLSGFPEGIVLDTGETIAGSYIELPDENDLDDEGNPKIVKVLTGWHKVPQAEEETK